MAVESFAVLGLIGVVVSTSFVLFKHLMLSYVVATFVRVTNHFVIMLGGVGRSR